MDQGGTTSAGHDVRAARTRTWLTVPELATFLRSLLDAGDHEDTLRFMLDGLNKIDEVYPDPDPATTDGWASSLIRLSDLPTEVGDFLSEPPSLGDRRWDTLLAASTAHVARHHGIAPPAWTTKPSLDQWWWPAGEQRRRALTMQRTPVDFRRVGIWFSERNFLTA